MKSMKFVCGLALALSTVAFAETKASANKSDLFVGYTRVGASYAGYSGAVNGIEFAAHGAFSKYVGVEGDFANGLGSASRGSMLLVGPRVSFRPGGVNVFAHAMVGGQFASGAGVGVYALGGGADVPMTKHLAWRLGGDYIRNPNWQGVEARLNTGLVVRF